MDQLSKNTEQVCKNIYFTKRTKPYLVLCKKQLLGGDYNTMSFEDKLIYMDQLLQSFEDLTSRMFFV